METRRKQLIPNFGPTPISHGNETLCEPQETVLQVHAELRPKFKNITNNSSNIEVFGHENVVMQASLFDVKKRPQTNKPTITISQQSDDDIKIYQRSRVNSDSTRPPRQPSVNSQKSSRSFDGSYSRNQYANDFQASNKENSFYQENNRPAMMPIRKDSKYLKDQESSDVHRSREKSESSIRTKNNAGRAPDSLNRSDETNYDLAVESFSTTNNSNLNKIPVRMQDYVVKVQRKVVFRSQVEIRPIERRGRIERLKTCIRLIFNTI